MQRAATLLLVLLLGAPALAQGPALTAFVDRTDIAINDIITLTLRIDSSLAGSRPQFSGLNREFEQVGGISSRSTYTNNNGNIQSWTEYSIMLRPLSTGILTIPTFRINGQASSPIQINVGAANQRSSDENNEIFLRTTVSKDSVYVQEQLLYTIKIYWSISFDQGAQLTSPQVADAVVQQLGSDDNHQEIVNGINYNVTQRKFVIFPQSSGELTIPPVYFAASVGRRGGINRLLQNSRSPVREINLSSETHHIEVKPQPASYPAGATWLPAKSLSLEETWSGNFDNLSVGDAVTRNVTLRADGLSSSLLPGISYQNQDGLRFYPDQPVREDNADADGVRGERAEGTAIVASMAGEFTLPEVRMPWWNTTTDSLETAVLPARLVKVQPPAAGDARPPVFTDQSGASSSGTQSLTALAQGTAGGSLGWIIATALFASAWAFTMALWLRSRQQLVYVQAVASPQAIRLPEHGNRAQAGVLRTADADVSLRILKTACDSGNLKDVRTTLLQWTQAVSADASIQTLEASADYWGHPEFTDQLKALDATLYGSGGTVDCKALYTLALKLHKQGPPRADHSDRYGLPPLYKS